MSCPESATLDVTAGEDRLLTTEQVAEVIEYSAGTLANWRVEGIGPKYISHRGRVRYRASDVQAWIKELPAE